MEAMELERNQVGESSIAIAVQAARVRARMINSTPIAVPRRLRPHAGAAI